LNARRTTPFIKQAGSSSFFITIQRSSFAAQLAAAHRLQFGFSLEYSAPDVALGLSTGATASRSISCRREGGLLMAWEVNLFRRTRLGAHRHCLELAEAYADFAPLWERCCLAAYVGIGPPLARWFGADTKTLWRRADAVIADLFAVSRLSAREIARLLRQYIRLRLERADHLPFDEARAGIYDQSFYPVVTHFTFALQPSAVARLKFIREVVKEIDLEQASVADLGCGSGVILCDVLALKPQWRGHGFDISEAAVNYARRLAAHKKIDGRADFRAGDIARLPYATDSLDLVIASEVIEHLPEPERVIAEVARVLKPGGKLILTMPLESHTPAHVHALSGPEDLHALCAKASLRVRRVEPKWHFGYGDDRKHLFALAEVDRAKLEPRRELADELSRACARG
jgi:SAM-dependent methyltransferase